jgi:3-deoxy-D-manno-octulosonic-acid transferase
MNPALARVSWSTGLRLLTPAYLARLWWRGRAEPAYRRAIGERFGFVEPLGQPGAVWVHAVSLGETRAAGALIDALRDQLAGMRLVLTHGTATGREAGASLLRDGDRQFWLPYDTPGSVRRFLERVRPALGVLMETELWPNLLFEARRQRVPMMLVNARLSEKSAALGQRYASLIEPAVATLALVLAQTADDARRFSAAGARTVVLSGNLKYDMTPLPALVDRGRAWRAVLARPVVMAASTREGEELPLLQAWSRISKPRPLLLVVPRHPQRFDEVYGMARHCDFSVMRRSQWGEQLGAGASEADVWIGDTLGEMPLYYALSDVALLGGSFAELGGQNLIEAAACACPVVMGPHTFNFTEAAELAVAARAAWRVDDIEQGIKLALTIANDPDHDLHARRALAFAASHRGAAQTMARRILEAAELLPAASPAALPVAASP